MGVYVVSGMVTNVHVQGCSQKKYIERWSVHRAKHGGQKGGPGVLPRKI